jgi:hypothetical protein
LQLRHRAHHFGPGIVELRLKVLDLRVLGQQLELEAGNSLVLFRIPHGDSIANYARRRGGLLLWLAGRADCHDSQ